jgi:hypothetical protein
VKQIAKRLFSKTAENFVASSAAVKFPRSSPPFSELNTCLMREVDCTVERDVCVVKVVPCECC